MDCPRCRSTATVRNWGDVEVDECGRCGGVFLDRGELNRIAEPTGGDLEYSTVHEDDFEHEDDHGPLECPRCRAGEMGKVEFNIYTGIILDFCSACGGFWLDRRELDRIHDEVRRLNEAGSEGGDPPMLWFARFIWTLPR